MHGCGGDDPCGEPIPTSISGVIPPSRPQGRSKLWDIVQVRPTQIPGRHVLWLSVDSELVSLTLHIPRQFYVHMRAPKTEVFRPDYYSYEKTTKNLPRDTPCVNLYKLTVKEDTYQDIGEHFIDLENDPNVDGVYEQQVSDILPCRSYVAQLLLGTFDYSCIA